MRTKRLRSERGHASRRQRDPYAANPRIALAKTIFLRGQPERFFCGWHSAPPCSSVAARIK
jgi:hypothetical protein